MHPGIAGDPDAPARHAPANPLDPSRVSADLQFVAAVALDREEVIHPALPFAQVHRQGADRIVPQRGDHVRRQDLGLQRDGRVLLEGKGGRAHFPGTLQA